MDRMRIARNHRQEWCICIHTMKISLLKSYAIHDTLFDLNCMGTVGSLVLFFRQFFPSQLLLFVHLNEESLNKMKNREKNMAELNDDCLIGMFTNIPLRYTLYIQCIAASHVQYPVFVSMKFIEWKLFGNWYLDIYINRCLIQNQLNIPPQFSCFNLLLNRTK